VAVVRPEVGHGIHRQTGRSSRNSWNSNNPSCGYC
jgi:hypothetical protein